jgi:hypothetical protein
VLIMGLLTGLAIAGAAGGAVMQGMAAEQAGKTEAAIHEYNAQVAEQGAETTATAGAHQAKMIRDRMRKDLARNQTLVAGSGFQMAGSPLDAQLNLIDEYAQDLGTLSYNTRIEQQKLVNQARLYRFQADAARQAGKIGVGQALFGGVSNLTQIGLMQRMLNK